MYQKFIKTYEKKGFFIIKICQMHSIILYHYLKLLGYII